MKYETLILQTLFAACMLVCVLTFGAMLVYRAPVATVATSHAPIAAQVGLPG